MSIRRRKWPTFRTSFFSLCVFVFSGGMLRAVTCFALALVLLSLSFFSLSVQAPDTFWSIVCHTQYKRLLFVGFLLFALILYSFVFVCSRRFGTIVLIFAIFFRYISFCTRGECCYLFRARTRTHVLRLRPSGGDFRCIKTCVALLLSTCVLVSVCISVNLPKPFLLCHARCVVNTGILESCVSFSHKTFYGKQVWQLHITKYKQKTPKQYRKYFFFASVFFGFTSVGLQVCLCLLCVGFKFALLLMLLKCWLS